MATQTKNLSVQQQAVVEWVLKGSGNAIVQARAGSGKTKTALACADEVKGRGCIAVFNRNIQQEIEHKNSNSNVKVKTFHSLGFQALTNNYDVRLDNDKHKRVQTEMEVPKHLQPFVRKLVDLAKTNFLKEDEPQSWEDTVDHYDVELEIDFNPATEKQRLESARKLGIELAKDCLREHLRMVTEMRTCDFGDMMYAPLELDCDFPIHDWLFIDEAQDTGVTRRRIAEKLLKRNGRLVALGDKFQSIFGFAGASNDALELLAKDFECSEMPLTVSFRCSKSVITSARSYVPDIEAAPNAVQGSVTQINYDDLFVNGLRQEDAILCRYTRPLVKLAYELIGNSVPCHVEGRDIGKGLIKMISRFRSAKTIRQLLEVLLKYRDERFGLLMEQGKEDAAQKILDQCETISIIASNHKLDEPVSSLTSSINNLFQDNADTLTLSTIHRAKGREWPKVFWLHNSSGKNKFARKDWQQQQERNLKYVAVTRAMNDLVVVDLPSKPGIK